MQRRYQRKRARSGRTIPFWVVVATVAAAVFTGTLYALTPSAPGRAWLGDYVRVRTTDQHYTACAEVHAAGRFNLTKLDPSFRTWMDGDGDGFGCEPYIGF